MSLLDLPDIVLEQILLQALPPVAYLLGKTCRHLRGILLQSSIQLAQSSFKRKFRGKLSDLACVSLAHCKALQQYDMKSLQNTS